MKTFDTHYRCSFSIENITPHACDALLELCTNLKSVFELNKDVAGVIVSQMDLGTQLRMRATNREFAKLVSDKVPLIGRLGGFFDDVIHMIGEERFIDLAYIYNILYRKEGLLSRDMFLGSTVCRSRSSTFIPDFTYSVYDFSACLHCFLMFTLYNDVAMLDKLGVSLDVEIFDFYDVMDALDKVYMLIRDYPIYIGNFAILLRYIYGNIGIVSENICIDAISTIDYMDGEDISFMVHGDTTRCSYIRGMLSPLRVVFIDPVTKIVYVEGETDECVKPLGFTVQDVSVLLVDWERHYIARDRHDSIRDWVLGHKTLVEHGIGIETHDIISGFDQSTMEIKRLIDSLDRCNELINIIAS